MNKIISQYNAEYLDSVLRYSKALQQRNKLLKDFRSSGKFDSDVLSIWDSQLVKYGIIFLVKEISLLMSLFLFFRNTIHMISSGKEKVKLNYRSHLSEGNFPGSSLNNSLTKDRFLEYTTVGIHKDDLVLEMDDFP